MTKLSFIIPCYGSELTIKDVVNEIIQTVKLKIEYSYEILLVNDCSPDKVYNVIMQLAKENPYIKGINLSKNFGQHSALMTGFNYATGDIILCLDDDGQTPAEEMFKIIDKVNEGYDIVFAKYEHKKHNSFRNIGSKVNDLMAQHLIGKPKGLALTSYFACKRFVIDEMIKYKNSYPYIAGLLLRTSNNIINVPVNHKERISGKSGYSLGKLLFLWLNGFTSFSVKPLRIATFIGVICALLGFFYGAYTIINKIINPAIPVGYSSLMSAVIFIGGILMLMLGMLGEYVGRLYISINNSPQYVVRETINVNDKQVDKHE